MTTAKQQYSTGLEKMSDQELFDEACKRIWLSGFAANNPRSDYHWQVDLCYDEANRRGKVEIYEHAYRVTYQQEIGNDPHPEQGPIRRKWPGLSAVAATLPTSN